MPTEIPLRENAGVFIGLGGNMQNGTFYTSCPCDFIDATGTGFLFGLLYEKEIFKRIWLGAEGSFDILNVTGTYIEIEPVDVANSDNTFTERIPVSTRHNADVNLNQFSLMPFLRYDPFDFAYLKLGFSMSFLGSADFKHTQELISQTVRMSNEEIGTAHFTDDRGEIISGNSVTLEEADLYDLNSFQMYLVPSVGFNIRINTRFTLVPSFQYSIPLTNISNYGKTLYERGSLTEYEDLFNVSSWRIRLGLSISLLSDKYLQYYE